MKDILKRILCVGMLLMICCVWIGGFYFIAPAAQTNVQKENTIAFNTNMVVQENEIIQEPTIEKTEEPKNAEGTDNVVKESTIAALSNEQLADEVIAGKWGTGTDRAEKLAAAGYDFKAIQDIVNKKVETSTSTSTATATAAKQAHAEKTIESSNSTPVQGIQEPSIAALSKGKIIVPSTGTKATIKTATFEPYNVQKIIDQGYAAYYSDYASTASKKIYGGHNTSAFVGLNNVTIGAEVWVDGVKYTVRQRATGGPDDWSPLFKDYSSNKTIILQTCSGKGYNNYIICY